MAIKPTTGLIFVPGARVDARAYAHVLRPLVEAGYFVAVLKEPFGFSVLDPTIPRPCSPCIRRSPTGRSAGTRSAASRPRRSPTRTSRVTGLVLYASYPASRIDRTDLKVFSVSGTADGLTTPAEIEASQGRTCPHDPVRVSTARRTVGSGTTVTSPATVHRWATARPRRPRSPRPPRLCWSR